jgi:hypothetical protein
VGGADCGECGRGAARGECGESVESFCSRGRSAYVGFSCLLLLAPVRGGTSFLCKRAKKRSKETRFNPRIPKCRRWSLQIFGTNVVPPPTINAQSNTLLKRHPHALASPRQSYINCYSSSRSATKRAVRALHPGSHFAPQSPLAARSQNLPQCPRTNSWCNPYTDIDATRLLFFIDCSAEFGLQWRKTPVP